ncbi:MAG: biopolymer transporter ExbD [Xanthomonadales bacterium]|nr:biopolymer transporter ExbD [Xanthomonadales bacterium]
MASINVTPLVDVMLVLLIIFMITTPLMQAAVEVELPVATLEAPEQVRQDIDLAVESDGRVWWDNRIVTMAQLETELRRAARTTPQPEVKIRADQSLRYQTVREVLETVKNAGIVRVGFVTSPDR